eukprot:TRINITY_DN1895_c0_g1_i1.p1 TRINITY_DN1895_c0_g1~~TRINITY_DN1895_c0_g1_i1.p1  ORF type:complete len:312 (+),score=120.65 TRINITY_DN1895_c0_g1_i1:63-998(+)
MATTKRIGVYISENKKRKMNFVDFVSNLSNKGFEFFELDPSKSVEEQAAVDLVLLKLDELAIEHLDPKPKAIVQFFEDYEKKNKNIPILAPSIAQRALMNREDMSKIIDDLEQKLKNVIPIRCPRSLKIVSEESDYTQILDKHGLQYPLICKKMVACGTTASHDMLLVFRESDLHQFQVPFVAQEFFNHDSVIFKVFVMNDFTSTVARSSLPNYDLSTPGTVNFCSRSINFNLDLTKHTVEFPPDNLIKQIAIQLNEMKMYFFGFDIIKRSNSNEYALIDINFWPGYVGVPNVFDLYAHQIEQIILKHQTK